MPSASEPMSAAYVITTICSAIMSWSRIMKPATAMISTGAAVPTIRPVDVSPIVRATSAATPAAIAPAARKMSSAAITFGM
jgi:hypothetical protein